MPDDSARPAPEGAESPLGAPGRGPLAVASLLFLVACAVRLQAPGPPGLARGLPRARAGHVGGPRGRLRGVVDVRVARHVGYGDVAPVTPLSRLVAVGPMGRAGSRLLGTVTGSFSS